jgi:hypothetical protein
MFLLRSMNLLPMRTWGAGLLVMCDACGAFVDPPIIDILTSRVLNLWGPLNAAIASVVASTIMPDE